MLKILARDDRMTLKISYAAVQEWGVARDMAHGLPNADMAARSANNESQFALEVKILVCLGAHDIFYMAD